jgi:predicted nucleic acid-binding Zn ribbon protein
MNVLTIAPSGIVTALYTEVIPLAGRMFCATCKPVALQRLQEGLPATGGGEAIRHQYLKHEASVKSAGFLYYLGGVLSLLVTVVSISMFFHIRKTYPDASPVRNMVSGTVFMIIAGLSFVLGYGLRRLKPWARVPTAILSGFGLLGFPIGTIINAYIMYLVLCAKGKMVFSEEYRDVIAQTPHIKYRSSFLVWILVGIIILLFLVLSFVVYFAPAKR